MRKRYRRAREGTRPCTHGVSEACSGDAPRLQTRGAIATASRPQSATAAPARRRLHSRARWTLQPGTHSRILRDVARRSPRSRSSAPSGLREVEHRTPSRQVRAQDAVSRQRADVGWTSPSTISCWPPRPCESRCGPPCGRAPQRPASTSISPSTGGCSSNPGTRSGCAWRCPGVTRQDWSRFVLQKPPSGQWICAFGKMAWLVSLAISAIDVVAMEVRDDGSHLGGRCLPPSTGCLGDIAGRRPPCALPK